MCITYHINNQYRCIYGNKYGDKVNCIDLSINNTTNHKTTQVIAYIASPISMHVKVTSTTYVIASVSGMV